MTTTGQKATGAETNSANLLQVHVAASSVSPSIAHLARRLRLEATTTTGNVFQLPVVQTPPMDGRTFIEYLYRTGKILNLPAAQHLTAKELAEREHRAELFGKGEPASEMLTKDRGLW